MKVQTYVAAAVLAGLFAFGSVAMAADQSSIGSSNAGSTSTTSSTSGPSSGGNVKPQTGAGAGGAAGVAGPAGSKNGPPQQSGSSDTQK